LLLLREFDDVLALTEAALNLCDDARDSRYVTHRVATLLRQRVYQIIAGYEDANDATTLRHDATFQIVTGRGTAAPVGSQPTLSRWENEVSWRTIWRLADLGVAWFCAHAFAPGTHPREIILEPDGTDDPAHGAQQLALFVGGHYGQRMYQPLIWTEGHTQLPLRTRLRPGRSGQPAGAVADLRHLLPPLRRRFSGAPVQRQRRAPQLRAAAADGGRFRSGPRAGSDPRGLRGGRGAGGGRIAAAARGAFGRSALLTSTYSPLPEPHGVCYAYLRIREKIDARGA
jgi:hypothetical protein